MTAVPPAQPESARRNLLARYPVTCFFVLAYAFSWIVWSPWVLGQDGAGLLPTRIGQTSQGVLNAAAIFAGPTLAALIVTAAADGKAGVKALLRRVVLWRVRARWYLFALLGVPAIMLLGFAVYSGTAPDFAALGGPLYLVSYVLTFVVVIFLGGPLFEEIGWRGFALPRMQRRDGPLVAAVTLGVLWAFWHLPEFLVPSWAASSARGCTT